LVIFEIESHDFCQAGLDFDPPTYTSHIADDRHSTTHPALLVEVEPCEFFAQTNNPPSLCLWSI
jgi:hypothetical protein